MKTLISFLNNPPVIPSASAWYIEAIAESKGRQELFIKQSPQKLKVLREHALIESAISSNRYMQQLIKIWNDLKYYIQIPFIVLLGAFNLDFLCIHPFRDGNGRVSRLLMLLQAYHGGINVGQYISLERLIEENKERYYETLEQSSKNWHEENHDPWPYIQFVAYIFKTAYKEFESRLGKIEGEWGEKRKFNVTGLCNPKMHYMADISDKIRQIEAMVEQGNYFTINRARQYGKTTTLLLLERKLINDSFKEIRNFTNGYPYLVSRICQKIENDLDNDWTQRGIDRAVKLMLSEDSTLIDDIFKNINNNKDLDNLMFSIVAKGKQYKYSAGDTAMELGLTFGFLIKNKDDVYLGNKFFEMLFYRHYSQKLETERQISRITIPSDVIEKSN